MFKIFFFLNYGNFAVIFCVLCRRFRNEMGVLNEINVSDLLIVLALILIDLISRPR